jgi:hypothetical protein
MFSFLIVSCTLAMPQNSQIQATSSKLAYNTPNTNYKTNYQNAPPNGPGPGNQIAPGYGEPASSKQLYGAGNYGFYGGGGLGIGAPIGLGFGLGVPYRRYPSYGPYPSRYYGYPYTRNPYLRALNPFYYPSYRFGGGVDGNPLTPY